MLFTVFFQKKSRHWLALIAMLSAMLAASHASAATTTIVAKHSGKCLDVRGGVAATGNGAGIEQWTCTGQANQAWTLKDMGSGQYEIIASNSNKCVDVFNGGTANGTAIQQMDCTGQPRQLWKLNSLGGGQYQIISAPSGRCLDVTGGAGATADGVLTELWDCVPQAANQSWALTAPTGDTTTQINNLFTKKCLDVTGGPSATGNGVPIEQWTCTGQSNQSWTAKDMGGYKYEFIASNSGKCLSIAGGNSSSGTPIQQANCTGQPNQLWTLLTVQARQFKIVSVLNAGNCLSVTGANGGVAPTNDGATIEAAQCTYPGDPSQSWAMDVAQPIKYYPTTSQCLDVRGGEQATADGTPTELWSCIGASNQLWTIKDVGNGYQIVARNSGKCLDLVGGATTDGTKLQISQCANKPSQLWTTENIGRGNTMIKSVASANKSCLDIVGGSTAAADGVSTDLTKCTTFELWNIGTPAGWP